MAENWLLSAGLELVLSQTEKSCIASNYRQFSTNIKIKIIKLIPVLILYFFILISTQLQWYDVINIYYNLDYWFFYKWSVRKLRDFPMICKSCKAHVQHTKGRCLPEWSQIRCPNLWTLSGPERSEVYLPGWQGSTGNLYEGFLIMMVNCSYHNVKRTGSIWWKKTRVKSYL